MLPLCQKNPDSPLKLDSLNKCTSQTKATFFETQITGVNEKNLSIVQFTSNTHYTRPESFNRRLGVSQGHIHI